MPHRSDSTAQREAEAHLRATLAKRINVDLAPRKIELGDGVAPEVDGCSQDGSVIVELYARIGKTKPGQRRKIASDILKLLLIEKRRQKPCRKILGFADEVTARCVRSNSWLAAAVEACDFEVHVLELPPEQRSGVETAQPRQFR